MTENGRKFTRGMDATELRILILEATGRVCKLVADYRELMGKDCDPWASPEEQRAKIVANLETLEKSLIGLKDVDLEPSGKAGDDYDPFATVTLVQARGLLKQMAKAVGP